jgi:uracil-DNA glycosylase family 4
MLMEEMKTLGRDIRKCSLCGLDGHVVGTVVGDPDQVKVLFVGEAPGDVELEKGVPFIGPSGQIIRKVLDELGLNNYAMINVLKCHPPGNKTPTMDQMKNCLPFLKQQVSYFEPEVVIALGKIADKALDLLGIDHKKVYHPAYLLHSGYPMDRYKSDVLAVLSAFLKQEAKASKPAVELPRVAQIPQLHAHSEFSTGDSIRSPEDMATVAETLGIKHLAITDHGTLAGVYQFEEACKKHNLHGIIGYEGYIRELEDGKKTAYIYASYPYIADQHGRKYFMTNLKLEDSTSSMTICRVEGHTAEDAKKLILEGAIEFVKRAKTFEKTIHDKEYTDFVVIINVHDGDGTRPGSGHMLILVKNLQGWKNLVYIHNQAVISKDYSRKPVIPLQLLKQYCEGLVIGSACRGGLLFQHWDTNPAEAEIWAKELNEHLKANGSELVLETMPHPLVDRQIDYNQWLYDIGNRNNIRVIVTTDCHYSLREDKAAKVAGAAIAYKNRELRRDKDYFPGETYYYQPKGEVLNNLGLQPEEAEEVIQNTEALAKTLNFELPRKFDTPKAVVSHLDLETLVWDAYKKFSFETPKAEIIAMGGAQALIDRIEMELDRINRADFGWYFLIEYSLCQALDERGILRGPGRGSASGSFVSYLLDITRVNPITQHLLFERFLPEGRQDPPDFDLDVQQSRRQEAITLLGELLGKQQTAQIVAFTRWHEKLEARDVCWLLNQNPDDLAAGHIPEAIAEEIKELSSCLDGHIRHKTVHPAGVVALPDIVETLPLTRVKGGGRAIELELKDLLALNLPKFDILGLETLDYIAEMLRGQVLAEAPPGTVYSTKELNLKIVQAMRELDKELHKLTDDDIRDLLLFARIYPYGIFQLGTKAGEELMRLVPPEYFEDVVRVVALNRPGTRPLITAYKERRMGEVPWEAEVPSTEDSYGLIIYQEQVLRALNSIFGMTMQEADQARRAISKKKLDKLKALEEGTLKEQLQDETKKKQWEEILLWAGYGFNRSHAVAYAWISLMTVYLKIKSPALCYAIWLNLKTEGTQRRMIVREATSLLGIENIIPFSLGVSVLKTIARGERLYLGLTTIRGIGEKTGQKLLDKINEGKKLSPKKVELFDKINGEVSIWDYRLAPLPRYKTVNEKGLLDMEIGETMEVEAILEAGLFDYTLEDNTGTARAKYREKKTDQIQEGPHTLLVYRGGFSYYILEDIKNEKKIKDNTPIGIRPIGTGQWRIAYLKGPLTSKKSNLYYRAVIYREGGLEKYEAHEVIIMKFSKALFEGMTITGELSNNFFRLDIQPELLKCPVDPQTLLAESESRVARSKFDFTGDYGDEEAD